MLLKEYGFEHIFNTYLQALRSIGEEAEEKLVESLKIADKDKKNSISSFMENAKHLRIVIKISKLTDIFYDNGFRYELV